MAGPALLDGLEEVHTRFDGLIVDQWGVLHDGGDLHHGSLETLRRLREAGRRVVLLSNTGRRLVHNLAQLRRMWLDDGLVDGVVTSGETAWQMLAGGEETLPVMGRRCLLWSEGRDGTILDGLDLEPVDRPDAADFILLAGIPWGCRPDDLRPELEVAARRGVPMVCCNPDRVVVVSSGIIPATGSIARAYEDRGGSVHYVGKPHPPVYRACRELLGPIPAERILAVGDSLEHDIAGGAGAGFATALTLTGIHADEHGGDPERGQFWQRLGKLTRQHGACPDFVLPGFAWTREGRNAR